MVREVEVSLPRLAGVGGGKVKAIAFEDMPGRAVGTYFAVSPEVRGTVGMGLLAMAVGAGVDLEAYGYGELQEMVHEWMMVSADEEAAQEVDWSGLLC